MQLGCRQSFNKMQSVYHNRFELVSHVPLKMRVWRNVIPDRFQGLIDLFVLNNNQICTKRQKEDERTFYLSLLLIDSWL